MYENEARGYGYQYHNEGRDMSQSEFEEICIVPLVGRQRSKQCLTIAKYQLFCLWRFPSCASLIVHKKQDDQREYIYLSDYRIQVFFRILGNICHIDGVAR